jgi:hypothetical protein
MYSLHSFAQLEPALPPALDEISGLSTEAAHDTHRSWVPDSLLFVTLHLVERYACFLPYISVFHPSAANWRASPAWRNSRSEGREGKPKEKSRKRAR